MSNKTVLAGILLTVVMLQAHVSPVLAGIGSCQPAYGSQNCEPLEDLSVDLKVQNPATGQYVDSLSINDPRYQAGSTVSYKITLTNNGTSPLNTVVVRDFFPKALQFASGPGQYDKANNIDTFVVRQINPKESQDYYLNASILGTAVNGSNPIVCDTASTANRVQASVGNKTANDSAVICIENQAQATGTPGGLQIYATTSATHTPQTGPELFGLIGLLPSALAGVMINKKSAKFTKKN